MKIKCIMTPNCQTLVDLNVILYICGSSDWIWRRTDFIHAPKHLLIKRPEKDSCSICLQMALGFIFCYNAANFIHFQA